MSARFLPLILPLLALLALNGCSEGSSAPAAAGPAKEALAAVVESPGAPRRQLATAVDALFTRPETAETRAVLVMRDGRIVAERYATGYHQNTRFVSWSMAKTITAVMIGQLVADGRLRSIAATPRCSPSGSTAPPPRAPRVRSSADRLARHDSHIALKTVAESVTSVR